MNNLHPNKIYEMYHTADSNLNSIILASGDIFGLDIIAKTSIGYPLVWIMLMFIETNGFSMVEKSPRDSVSILVLITILSCCTIFFMGKKREENNCAIYSEGLRRDMLMEYYDKFVMLGLNESFKPLIDLVQMNADREDFDPVDGILLKSILESIEGNDQVITELLYSAEIKIEKLLIELESKYNSFNNESKERIKIYRKALKLIEYLIEIKSKKDHFSDGDIAEAKGRIEEEIDESDKLAYVSMKNIETGEQ